MRRLEQWLATLDVSQIIMWTVVLAIAFELLTLAMRFGAGLQSTRDTDYIGYLSFGIRIHHGYIGLIMLLIAAIRPEPAAWRNLTVLLGAALVLSDIAHHYLVLWPLTGSPEFDLMYPRIEPSERIP